MVTISNLKPDVIYADEAEARQVLEAAIKDYSLVAETRGVYTHITAVAVAYYDADKKPQILSKAGICGKSAIAEHLFNELAESLGDLVAVFRDHQERESKGHDDPNLRHTGN